MLAFTKNMLFSEHQFVCGLSLALGKEAQLSRADIQKVVEFYRVDKDRVQYKEFCDMMENGIGYLIFSHIAQHIAREFPSLSLKQKKKKKEKRR